MKEAYLYYSKVARRWFAFDRDTGQRIAENPDKDEVVRICKLAHYTVTEVEPNK